MAKNFTIYEKPVSPSIFGNMKPIYYIPKYDIPRDYEHLTRYNSTRRILDENVGVLYHETYINRKIPESRQDKYITVSRMDENRLDIISDREYGYSLYWWIIAIANDIIDPFNIPAGTVLRIPPLSSLYSNGSVLGQ